MADMTAPPEPALTDCPEGSTWSNTLKRCVRTSYGVNQGDQASESARNFESMAKREAARMSYTGRQKAAELRGQAERLRER